MRQEVLNLGNVLWGEEGPSTPRGNGCPWDFENGAKPTEYAVEDERGRGVVRQGWRTPDPSPLRTTSAPPAKCQSVAKGSRPEPQPIEPPAALPPSRGREFSSPEEGRCNSPAWTRIRTPSPDDDVYFGYWKRDCMPPVQSDALEVPKEESEGVKIKLDVQIQLDPLMSQLQLQARTSVPPPPPPVPPTLPWWGCGRPAASNSMFASRGERAAEACAALSMEEAKPLESAWIVSRGSVGHPHNCKEACKYVIKKRGCKDGVNCDRCHLCNWKRHPAPAAARRGTKNSSGIRAD